MLIKKICVIIASFVCIATTANATLKVSLTPEVGLMNGYTEYEMDYYFEFLNYITDPPVNTVWRINSLLEFPLDATVGGLSVDLTSDYDVNKWNIKLKHLRTISESKGIMKDSDFEGFSTLFPYAHIIYTESDADNSMFLFELEARVRIMKKDNWDLSLFLGGRYQQIDQDVEGYNGWARPFDTTQLVYFDSTVPISGAEDTLVLTYKLQLEQFSLGLQADINFTEKFTTQIKTAFAPVIFNDTDDHLLRSKRSTSNGSGLGFIGDLNLRYNNPISIISFIQLNSSFNSFKAEGSQMQLWYENELGFDAETDRDLVIVRKNSVLGAIPHEIRSTQYNISLQLGFEF